MGRHKYGFKFSESKTICVHFCKLRTVKPDPVLLLNGTPIAVVEQVKFLGLNFDKQLSFIPHLCCLKQKCLKDPSLLRVVSSTKWGTDDKTLLHLYHALIGSKLYYGSVVYGSSRKSYLQMLDPVQNHALRFCLGAFRTSSVSSLHVEANEMPLELRRRKLAAQYCFKVSTDTSNLAVDCTFNKHFTALLHRYPSQIRPLCFRVTSDLHAIHFAQKDILPVLTPSHPSWLYSKPVLDLSLNKLAKSDTSPEIFQSNLLAVCDELSDYHHIYTDGSKMNNSVAAAAVSRDDVESLRIPDKASISTTELVALNLALDIVWHSRHKKFVIFSDSLSSDHATQNLQAESVYIMKFLKTIQHW